MEIRSWAEISIQEEAVFEPEAVIRNEENADRIDAAKYFIKRIDFLRAWASEYKGSSVNAD